MLQHVNGSVIIEDASAYHAHPALSASGIKEFLRSPMHYKHRYIDKNVPKPTDAMRFGTLVHLALIEPKKFRENMAIEPDCRRNTNQYKDWLGGLRPTAVVVSTEEAEAIVGMKKSLESHPNAMDLLERGIAEHSMYFERDGISCKSRPDFLHEDRLLVELKTARDASYEFFHREIWNRRYDVQAAWNIDAANQVFGDIRSLSFIVIEKEPPYPVAVYVADDFVVEMGRETYKKMLPRFKECLESNTWPGYQKEAQNISLPGWVGWRENQ